MKKTAAISFLILGIILSASTAGAKIHFGPYIQSLSASETAVCFFADPQDRVTVELQGEPQPIRRTAEGARSACAKFRDLNADETYSYSVFLDEEPVPSKSPLSFVPYAAESGVFVIYGDTRSGDDSFDLTHAQIVQAINESVVPDAVIHTGDLVEFGGREDLIANFFNIEKELTARAPIFPAIGQSDQPPDLMRKVFPLLADNPWYSFDRAGAHFVICNLWKTASQKKVETSADGKQAAWLRDDLANAKKRGAKYIFAVVHEPVIDANGNTPKALRDVFTPIFENFGVTAVFSGAHYFSHATKNGVHYFTNGGGGALLESAPPRAGVYRYYSAVHHFLVLEIDRTGARVKAVDAHGGEFYEATLGGRQLSAGGASTFVESYGQAENSVILTVYYKNKSRQADPLAALFEKAAARNKANIVATYRSLESPENRASLEVATDRREPLPIIVAEDDVLFGTDEIELRIDETISRAAHSGISQKLSPRLFILAIAVFAGVILVFKMRSLLKRRKTS